MRPIKRIYDEDLSYEVSKDGVVKIEHTTVGTETTTIYLITYENDSTLYVGLLEHDIDYGELEE